MEKLDRKQKRAYTRMAKNWDKLRKNVHMQIVERIVLEAGGINQTAAARNQAKKSSCPINMQLRQKRTRSHIMRATSSLSADRH